MTLALDKHPAKAFKVRQTALGSPQVELCSFSSVDQFWCKKPNKQTNKQTSPESDLINAPQAESEASEKLTQTGSDCTP